VTTWHGFAEEIFRLASEYESLVVKRVEPISTSEYPTLAKRPANSVLDCSPTKEYFGIAPKPWHESLARMLKRIFLEE
jgi:dTDP-4-dehydrorhamnose reductase